MLFTLGLFLLLTPLPSFQTPISDKRDSIAREGTKATTVLTLLKPKTTVAPAKPAARSALKPNAVNQTVLPSPTTTPKPPTGSAAGTAKSKPSPPVIQTTTAAPAKAAPASGGSNKDKHTASVNQTTAAKPQPATESKATRDKPAPTGSLNVQPTVKPASGPRVRSTKEKPLVTQSVSVKVQSTNDANVAADKPNKNRPQSIVDQTTTTSEVKGDKEKSVSSRTSTAQSADTKPASSKQTKEKPQVSVTVTTKSSDATTAKDKAATTTGQNAPTTPAKSGSGSVAKTSKKKPVTTGSQAVTAKPSSPSTSADKSSKDKAATQTVKPTAKPPTTANKSKALPSANQTLITKPSKPSATPAQPIKVVISEGCESSTNKEEEMELKPGSPLVMTHKISLVPGSCTGGCEAKMSALEGRVALLEKEMSSLKEKCACSASCPNDCSGNGECQRGKCVCLQGFMGPDCSKIIRDKSKALVETGSPSSKKDGTAKQKKGPDAKEVSKVITTKTVQSLLNKGKKQEELRTGKPTIMTPKKTIQHTDSTSAKSDKLKDEPHVITTQVIAIKINGTTKSVMETSKTREQSTITEKETTQQSKKAKGAEDKLIEDAKTEKAKDSTRSMYIINITSAETETGLQQNKTIVDPKRLGGSGLGSVKVVNVSSYSFILTWSAPQGMFKNFTVIRREPRTDTDETEEMEEEEVLEKDEAGKNATEIHVQSETNTNATASGKVSTTKGKAERRISMVVPGNTRSVEFSNLRANTKYVLSVYGTGAERRSKTHQVTALTGPEPIEEVFFGNLTETSFAVSWNKPKGAFTGYRITYINIVTGESHSVTVSSEHTSFLLSKLSAGTSYIVTVTTMHGRVQSDPHTSLITTVPAPPTHLRAADVSDTKALLKWTPSPGKVDRFIITYESSKTPNVTVTVMLSGNTVEHQLKSLQRGTLYTVKVLSQKDNHQSPAVSTSFTTANSVRASEVGARYAVISWKQSTFYRSYRITYQVVGEEAKEIILDPTVTEYKLTGLLPMSRYMVLVQGERDGHYTSLVTTEFITGKLRFPFPTECSQELLNGALQSGEVDIYPQGKEGHAVKVYCDMETDGGGWTVFQRRMNGKTDFYRTWNEYITGFGNISEEFWLGNRLLHNLTSFGPVSLRVDMRSGNDTAYAHYSNFSIDSEEKHFALTVSGYTGNAGDSMRYHNGRPFSTRDKDPDPLGIHCARAYMGGWWYKNCYKTNLNGLYGINSNNQGIVWIDWKGKDSSIPFNEMKFRPARFSPATHG